jgi:lysophospholipase L1-like esterase
MKANERTTKLAPLAGEALPAAGRLPKRDYILLPLIALATIIVLAGCGEILARTFWEAYDDNVCAYQTPLGQRFRPNCTSPEKAAEGPWTVNAYNECGYRTAESCAVRGPDQLRVVVLGSSTARGALVPYEQTFAARASATLTSTCGGLVDFQNLATGWSDVDRTDSRIPEALALKPTAIIIVIGPYDIEHLKDETASKDIKPPAAAFGINLRDINGQLRKSRLFLVGQHYLYRDPAVHIAGLLSDGSDSSRFLGEFLPETWRKRVDDAGALFARISALTAPANVPVLVFYIPSRPQAALAVPKYSRPSADPKALGEALRGVARQNGVTLIDLTQDFAGASDFGSLYYEADGHPTPAGHDVIAKQVESTLLSLPAFNQCRALASAPN